MFKSYFEQTGASIKELSDFTGIDRSTVYKMLSGTREPKNVEVVEKLAEFLCLGHREHNQLIEAFYLTKWGPFRYYGRKEATNFFLEFGLDRERPQAFFPYSPIQIAEQEKVILRGESNVNIGIESLLFSFCRTNRSGTIKVCEPVLNDVTLRILEKLMEYDPDLSVSHVLSLDNTADDAKDLGETLYNIQVLRKIIPVLTENKNYSCNYVYNRILAMENSMSFLPNYILAAPYVILYSNDHSEGILMSGDDLYHLYDRQMTNSLERSAPLARSIDYASFCRQLIDTNLFQQDRGSGPVYYFHAGIRMSAILSQEDTFIQDHLRDTFPNREQFQEDYSRYLGYYEDTYSLVRENLIEFFTKQGIDWFVKEGLIGEIHPDVCYPLSLDERYSLLSRWTEKVRENNIRMLDFTGFQGSSTLSVLVGQSKALLAVGVKAGTFCQEVIDESSISRTFYDFFEFQYEQSVYPKEATLSYLNTKLEELREQILAEQREEA